VTIQASHHDELRLATRHMGSLLTSLLFHILRGMHVALVIYAPSLVINLVTGLPVWECILFMGCFTTFYTALGSMRAVIWTDVIQFCAVSVACC